MLLESDEKIDAFEVSCVQTGRPLHQLMASNSFKNQLRNWITPYVIKTSSVTRVMADGGPVGSSNKESTISAASCNLEVELSGRSNLISRVCWQLKDGNAPKPVDLSFYVGSQMLHSVTLTARQTGADDIVRTFSWPIPSSLFEGKENLLEIRASSPNHHTVSKSLLFGHGHFDSALKYVGGGKIEGFMQERVALPREISLQIAIDSKEFFDIAIEMNRGIISSNGRFTFTLPPQYLDGLPHLVELMADGEILQTIHVIYSLRGYIEKLDNHELVGWVYDNMSDRPLELLIEVDGIELPVVVADRQRLDVGRKCGFTCNLSPATQGKAAFNVTIKTKETLLPILQTPKYYFRTDGLIETLRRLTASSEISQSNRLDDIAIAKYLVPRLIRELRNEVGQGVVLNRSPIKAHKTVKVIVPVYDGLEETLRCLLALFKSKEVNTTPFEVVLIDDCGPNPAISPMLKKVAQRPDVTLLVNELNIGFVRSVNKALRLTSGHDVVLLNADAVVNGNWLDRIHNIAYNDDRIASVTPFSNNATICSYPDPELENSMPEELSLQEIDSLCSKANDGIALEIPSGVGFCMYMKAEAIAEVGLLDAEKFGMGYGEENDWCVRARDIGWKHMHACDTFVEHIGGVSFGKDKKNNLVEKNLVVLGKTYPEYTPIIIDFIQSDPARIYRNRITVQRMSLLLSAARERHLYISHSFGGGIEVFCNNQAKDLERENIAVIMLESIGTEARLRYGELIATYRTNEELDELCTALKNLALNRIHVNSDIGHSTKIWDLADMLQVPLDVTIHDYTFVCPRVNFMTKLGNYCGEPSEAQKCDQCINKNGTYAFLDQRFKNLNSSVSTWREYYGAKLSTAENVYAPDEDAAERIAKYFPIVQIKVRPHTYNGTIPKIQRPTRHRGEILKVAVIGAIGPHKGFDLLHACVAHAHQNDLPLHFVVVGYTCDDDKLRNYDNISITGKFEQDMLGDILAEHNCHVSLFLSPWPETYSYTLTEALLAGLWPVVLPIGAQASRVKALEYGTILPRNTNAPEVNDILLSLAAG